MKVVVSILFLSVVLSGCTTIPAAVDRPLAEPQPEPAQVQRDPDQYRGQVARWGGSIIAVENTRDASVVEVVARPLQSNSRPDEGGMSPGRFVIVTHGFLDPEIFTPGKAITAVGTLDGIQVRKVGEYEYSYPVLRAEGYHLWAPRPERRVHDPYWDHPWGYPYGPSPYWRHPYYYPYYFW